MVLPGHGRGSGGRNAGTATLHGLPGTLLLNAGMGNTGDFGVLGRGGWYTMFKPGFTLVLQPTASSPSFGQLLSSQQVFRGICVVFFSGSSSAPFVGQTPRQTWLQGTDGAGGITGLLLQQTCFWERSEEVQEQPDGLITQTCRQQPGEQPASGPYGTQSKSSESNKFVLMGWKGGGFGADQNWCRVWGRTKPKRSTHVMCRSHQCEQKVTNPLNWWNEHV